MTQSNIRKTIMRRIRINETAIKRRKQIGDWDKVIELTIQNHTLHWVRYLMDERG